MSFHVPERFRVKDGPMKSTAQDGNNGYFLFPSILLSRWVITIASDGSDWEECELPGKPWEHVSVHIEEGHKQRIPTWTEMVQVKNLFWDEEDTVIQFHPAKAEYINNHPYTLHLWRPIGVELPVPPSLTVGIKGLEIKTA